MEKTVSFVSKNIKRIRESLGLTQAQFAELVGLSLSAIQRFEQNERTPRTSTLSKIAKKLDIYIDELVLNPDDIRLSAVKSSSVSAALKSLRTDRGISLEHVSKVSNIPIDRLKLAEDMIIQFSDEGIDSYLKAIGASKDEFEKVYNEFSGPYEGIEDPFYKSLESTTKSTPAKNQVINDEIKTSIQTAINDALDRHSVKMFDDSPRGMLHKLIEGLSDDESKKIHSMMNTWIDVIRKPTQGRYIRPQNLRKDKK